MSRKLPIDTGKNCSTMRELFGYKNYTQNTSHTRARGRYMGEFWLTPHPNRFAIVVHWMMMIFFGGFNAFFSRVDFFREYLMQTFIPEKETAAIQRNWLSFNWIKVQTLIVRRNKNADEVLVNALKFVSHLYLIVSPLDWSAFGRINPLMARVNFTCTIYPRLRVLAPIFAG